MSSICQYWAQGNCRFGNKCWNRHDSPLGSTTTQTAAKKGTDWRQMTDEEILKGIATEISTWESSKMWPLSVFSFANGAPILPGLANYSFEEIRLEAYNARAKNTFNEYVAKLMGLLNTAKSQKNMLKNPDPTCRAQLLEFIHKAKTAGSGTPFGQPAASSIGNTTTPSQQPSLFGSQQAVRGTASSSIFGGSTAQQPQVSAFGGSSQTKPSIFGGAVPTSTQPTGFGSSVPTQQTAPQNSPFGGTMFGSSTQPQQTQQSSPFGVTPNPAQSSNFGSVPSFQSQSGGLFGSTPQQPATPSVPSSAQGATVLFGKTVSAQPTVSSDLVVPGVYSALNELSEKDKEAFGAASFADVNSIPLSPPPKELCF